MVFTDWVFTKEVQPLTLGLLIRGFIGLAQRMLRKKLLKGRKPKGYKASAPGECTTLTWWGIS